jgi:hypothetical protein
MYGTIGTLETLPYSPYVIDIIKIRFCEKIETGQNAEKPFKFPHPNPLPTGEGTKSHRF